MAYRLSITERVVLILTKMKRLLQHEGFPGEIGASSAGIGIAFLGLLKWNEKPLVSIRSLEPVLTLDQSNFFILAVSLIHFAGLVLYRRHPAAIWVRWMGCVVLAGTWFCLCRAFWAAEPYHPIGMLYAVACYTYAYGGLYLLSRRNDRRAL